MEIQNEDSRLVTRFIVFEGIRNSKFENLHHLGIIKQATIRPTLLTFEDRLATEINSLSKFLPVNSNSKDYAVLSEKTINIFKDYPLELQCALLKEESLEPFYFSFSHHLQKWAREIIKKSSIGMLKLLEEKFLSDYYFRLRLDKDQKIKFRMDLIDQFNFVLPAVDIVLLIIYSSPLEIQATLREALNFKYFESDWVSYDRNSER